MNWSNLAAKVPETEAKDSLPLWQRRRKSQSHAFSACTWWVRHHAPLLCVSVSHACETQLDESGCAAARASDWVVEKGVFLSIIDLQDLDQKGVAP